MNILLVNHYAGSPALGMEFRPYRVQIVAADFSHVRACQPTPARAPGSARQVAGDEVVDGIAYRWYATPPYRGNGFGRVKNIAAFLRALWADTPRLVREFGPDVVIASSTYPMDIWVARHIARRAGARLVYEVHDLWPLSPIELSGMSPRHPFALVCQAAENAGYRDADLVVSMLPKVHGHMAAHGLDLKRLAIVPNGITLDEWEGEPAALEARVAGAVARARAEGRTVVGYAGSMGLPNALDTLLDAAALLRDEAVGAGRFAFVMVGDGHERERLAARIAAERLHHVALLPAIPKAQVPALLARVDIAYIGWQRVPIYRFGIAPNKLMDYLMARRVVLHSVEAGNDPVAEAGCGLTVPPGDAPAVAEGLRRLAALSAEERAAMGERGRAFVLANHTYPVLAARFIEAIEASRSPRSPRPPRPPRHGVHEAAS